MSDNEAPPKPTIYVDHVANPGQQDLISSVHGGGGLRGSGNPKNLNHEESSNLHHRPRTLFLIRHGEAVHNVFEAKAQEQAKAEAQAMNLSPEETAAKMEEARLSVLEDSSLRDAPLTERGKQQAEECGKRLQDFIDRGITHAPTEAMVSPLTRTLETCHIILDTVKSAVKANIFVELQERRTQFPPDMGKSRRSLFRYTQSNDRFIMDHFEEKNLLSSEDAEQEAKVRESKEMLRERASQLFHLLMKVKHRHILIVSHKGYLRELERGLLGLTDSPLFGNAELRVYRVVFTRGERTLESVERLA